MEIENFKVPFPEVSEHEIVPLEDRVTLWGQSAFLARLIELDLFQEMKTRVNPLARLFVSPSVFIVKRDAKPTIDGFFESTVVVCVDTPSENPQKLIRRKAYRSLREILDAAKLKKTQGLWPTSA